MKPSKSLMLIPLACVPLLALLLAGKTQKAAETDKVQRGKYLVHGFGCGDCHTPMKMGAHGPEPDLSRFLAGHPEDAQLPPPPVSKGPWALSVAGTTAWAGPWGVSYSANLTPDANTGLGIWTEDIFIKTMRTGKHFGTARDILPPMPWQSIGQLTDADLKAMFAYLRTIPAVKNHVPAPVPPGGSMAAKNQLE